MRFSIRVWGRRRGRAMVGATLTLGRGWGRPAG